MKKLICLSLLVLLLLCSSCTTIPNSVDAKEKLENAGYSVEMFTQYGDEVKSQGITQVTVIYATKDDDFLHAYFFASEEDTEAFYKNRTVSLEKDVEVIKKNKYSIYRGTKTAVDAFLK